MAKATEPVSIDGITFDALIDSDETWESYVPAYPVETGFEVSDTIIIRPIILNMSLYLTNTPVTWRGRHETGPHRVQDVLHRLKELYFKKTPVVVKTSEQDYTNMAIVNIGLPKKIETGTSRLMPISLQQIAVTEKQTTTIPASFGRGGATGVNAGTANTTARASGAGTGQGDQGDGSRGSIAYNLARGSGLLGRGGGAIGSIL